MKLKIRNILSLWRDEFITLLFPEYLNCERCGDDLITPVRFCGSCLEKSLATQKDVCTTCGRPLNGILSRSQKEESNKNSYDNYFGKCKQCQESFFFFKAHRAFVPYDARSKRQLLSVKYKAELQHVNTISDGLVHAFYSLGKIPEIDMVIPVPIYKTRRLFRGFNQAELYAKGFCKRIELPFNDVLIRIKATPKLKRLGKTARKNILKNAIIVKNEYNSEIKGKNILIVDDIFTTGETLNQSAKALYEAGAESIYAITYAMGTSS